MKSAGLLTGAFMAFASLGAGAQTAPASAPPRQTTSASADGLTLEQLEVMAIANNPTLRQADAEIAAARGRSRQAGLLPNPTIGYSAEQLGAPSSRGPEQGFFVQQTIPLFGKLGLGRAVFGREATQAELLAESQRLRVINAVRVLYFQTLLAERRVEVNERLAAISREAVGITAQLFNVGAADKPDYLQSEIEERRAQVQLTAAHNMRARSWRELAALVGDPGLMPRSLGGSIEADLPELERDPLLRTLLRDSPELKAARVAVERNELVVRRARRETMPDLVISAAPRHNPEIIDVGPQGGRRVGWVASLDVGLTIPLFNRNQGNIAAARAELDRAQAEVRRLELTLGGRFADVFEQYLTAVRSAEIYRRDILPRAEEAYQLYLARFREMAAAYPQVLVAQRTYVEMTNEFLGALETARSSAIQLQGFLLGDGLMSAERPGDPPAGAAGLGMGSASPMGGRRPGGGD